MRAFGESLLVYRPPIDTRAAAAVMLNANAER
jgi:nitrate reductase alpha subunit